MCITNETKAIYSNINVFFCIEICTCQFYFLFTLELTKYSQLVNYCLSKNNILNKNYIIKHTK